LRLYREREAREAAGLFLAEGLHLAIDAVRAGATVELALIGDGLAGRPEGAAVEQSLRSAGIETHHCADGVLDSLQQARTPQPILLLVRQPAATPQQLLGAERGTPLVVVADGVQDPGNLGTILRTAEAAGATGFIAAGTGADLFHPRTVRATAGAIFRLPALRMAAAEFRRRADATGLGGVVTDTRGECDLLDCPLQGPCALVFGSEGAGLQPDWHAWAVRRVRIPMAPEVESLSVGAAAAVLLYEARRQRGAPS